MAPITATGKRSRGQKKRDKIDAERGPLLWELKAALIDNENKRSKLNTQGASARESQDILVNLFTSLANLVRLFVASEEWWREEHPHWATLTGDPLTEVAFYLFTYIGGLSGVLLEMSHVDCLQPVFETWAGLGDAILSMLWKRPYLTSPSQATRLVEVRTQALYLLCPVIVFQKRRDRLQSKEILGQIMAFILASREGFDDPSEDVPTTEFLVASTKWIHECVSLYTIESSNSEDELRLDIGPNYQGYVLPFFSLGGTSRENIADRLNQLCAFHLLVKNQTRSADSNDHPLHHEMLKADVLGHYSSLLDATLPHLEVSYDTDIGASLYFLVMAISFVLEIIKYLPDEPVGQLEYVTWRISPFPIERWCVYTILAPDNPASKVTILAPVIAQFVRLLVDLPTVDGTIGENELLKKLDTVQRRMKQSSDVPDIVRDAWLTSSTPSDAEVCASHFCSSTDPNELRRCNSCKKKYYCSRECQRSHWKWHKKYCRRDGIEDQEADRA